MKFTKYILVSISSLLFSCNMLDENPIDFRDPDNYYHTDQAIINSSNGLYSSLKTGGVYGSQYVVASDVYASVLVSGGSNYDNFQYAGNNMMQPTHSYFQSIWNGHYKAISNANTTIDRVSKSTGDLTPELRDRVIAEAKFIRALMYFNLVRTWYEVPLRIERTTHLTDKDIAASSIDEIYSQIISDLKDAEEDLWNKDETRGQFTNDVGRATQLAAKTLLAKVYLEIASSTKYAFDDYNVAFTSAYDGQEVNYYTLAKEKLEEITTLPDFAIYPDWVKIWSVNNQNNSDMIFSVQYASGTGYGSSFFTLFTPRYSNINKPQVSGQVGVSTLMYKNINLANLGYSSYKINELEETRIQEGMIRDYIVINNPSIKLPSVNARWNDKMVRYEYTDKDGKVKAVVEGGTSKFYMAKYKDEKCAVIGTSSLDFPVIRATDVYLMLAEVKAELGSPTDGFNDYNIIRGRTNPDRLLDATELATYPGETDLEKFHNAILRERLVEFMGEGHRWYDLKRLGQLKKFTETLFKNSIGLQRVRAYDYYWPYPQSEVDINDLLDQRKGY